MFQLSSLRLAKNLKKKIEFLGVHIIFQRVICTADIFQRVNPTLKAAMSMCAYYKENNV